MTSNNDPGDQISIASSGDEVSGYEILRKLVELPISTWRYNDEEPHIRHLGPMAQDFKAKTAGQSPI